MPERQHSYRDATREEKLAELGVGPWLDEPDYEEWYGEGVTKGLVHIIVRGPFGNTCGYVGVPPGHPWHGKGYDEIEDARVHGGLTYAAPCNDHICHVPAPGEPEHLWWVGFDCGHAFDFNPRLNRTMVEHGIRKDVPYVEPPKDDRWVDRYRSWEYAKFHTLTLAWQAAKDRRWIEHRARQETTRHRQQKTRVAMGLAVKQRRRVITRHVRMILR